MRQPHWRTRKFIDGGCWRCHSPVEQKELEQWYLRITEYKERLLEDLKQLTHWPERVIAMQTNWIGRSRGLEIFSKCGTAAQTFRFYHQGRYHLWRNLCGIGS